MICKEKIVLHAALSRAQKMKGNVTSEERRDD